MEFTIPAISDSGNVAFNATIEERVPNPFPFPNPLPGPITARVLRWDLDGLTEIASTGSSAPDGNGEFTSFTDPSINDAGDVAFRANLNITVAGRFHEGVYRGNGQVLTQIARSVQSPSDSTGSFRAFGQENLNANGDVSFYGYLVASSTDFGLFHNRGLGVETLFRPGMASPDGNGQISSSSASSALNSSGAYAFTVSFSNSSAGSDDNRGVVMGSASGLEVVVRKGTTVPGGDGEFSHFFPTSLNDSGTLAFSAQLSGTTDGIDNDWAVFRLDQVALTELVREGQSAPDGNGTFEGGTIPAINNAGQVAFGADLRDTSQGAKDSEGVYLMDGQTMHQLARAGATLADNESVFAGFEDIALNNSGQVSFVGNVVNPIDGDYVGIYVSDAIQGPVELARTGSDFLGSQIVSLGLRGALGFRDSNESGLSDDGTVAFYFELEDGRSGIALARVVPEPKTLWVSFSCFGIVIWLRSRLTRRSTHHSAWND